MPIITQLFTYPVAGMQGEAVDELTITADAIQGNRKYAVVATDQLYRWIETPENEAPLRMTQVAVPQLTLFTARESNNGLQLSHKDDSFSLTKTTDSKMPFQQKIQANQTLDEVLRHAAIPIKVSRRSSTFRWAKDCGDSVAQWLSGKLEKECRLFQAIKHPDSKKTHFTWYTDLHLITSQNLSALSKQVGYAIDGRVFRANIITDDGDETATEVDISGQLFDSKACERCGYISINPQTGEREYVDVLTTVVKKHEKNFGLYLSPQKTPAVIKKGDIVSFLN